MDKRLADKVAVVTGAGKGIGRAVAERFAAEGARVICADIDPALAQAVASAIRAGGGEATGFVADVADAQSVADLAAQAGVVDIVCNNAGILDGFTPLGELSDALWQRILGVNLNGVFYVSRAFLPGMLEKGKGAFVNLASIAGLVAHAGGLAYTVSKHGVIGFTKQVAADYGRRGIRANAICPGVINTDLTNSFLVNAPEVRRIAESVPSGRQGQPHEVAALAAFLASDESGFMQGAAVTIDGGWTVV